MAGLDSGTSALILASVFWPHLWYHKHGSFPGTSRIGYRTNAGICARRYYYFLYWILRLPTKTGTPSLNHCRAGIGLPLALHINFKALLTFNVVLWSPHTPIGWTVNTKRNKINSLIYFLVVYKTRESKQRSLYNDEIAVIFRF